MLCIGGGECGGVWAHARPLATFRPFPWPPLSNCQLSDCLNGGFLRNFLFLSDLFGGGLVGAVATKFPRTGNKPASTYTLRQGCVALSPERDRTKRKRRNESQMEQTISNSTGETK